MSDLEIAYHSDEDGELWMHSDDPASVKWTVTVVGRAIGQDEPREVAEREESSIGFPALNWAIPLSAWCVGRNRCHIEIEKELGDVRILGPCPHS